LSGLSRFSACLSQLHHEVRLLQAFERTEIGLGEGGAVEGAQQHGAFAAAGGIRVLGGGRVVAARVSLFEVPKRLRFARRLATVLRCVGPVWVLRARWLCPLWALLLRPGWC